MRSFCFNSLNGDRKYRAENWTEYFATFIGNGVFAAPAASMQIKETSGLSVRVAAGKCFINGYAGYADGADILTLQYGGALPRIDRIVIRLDLAARNIYPAVITGTAAQIPVPPDIVRKGALFDLGIAKISVAANASAVTQAQITDTRSDSEVCGFVKGVVDQIDVTDLFAQYQAAWDNFFGSLTANNDKIIINTADEQARRDITVLKADQSITEYFKAF